MGLWPGCVRAGAGCPGRGPDVRGSGRMSGLKWPNFWCILSLMPDFRGRGRMSGGWCGAGCPGTRLGCPAADASAVCWCSSLEAAQAPAVRPLARMSCRCSFSSSVFFRRRFQASLADGVAVPWCLHSSSTSVKLRQYLCMHMGEVSSSIPSLKGSSEHV